MPTLIGILPEFGIKHPEEGILVESISYEGTVETYEQKDPKGRKCGVMTIDEEQKFSMSGTLPQGGDYVLKMGANLVLKNLPPATWSETPKATTCFITSVKQSLTNTGPVKLDISGTIYAFGAEEPGPAAAQSFAPTVPAPENE